MKMKKSAQEIITKIVSHIVNNGGDYKDWQIGITSSINDLLIKDEIIDKKSKAIYFQSKSALTAKLAAQTLIEQYDTNSCEDKLQNDGDYVYTYRKVSIKRNSQNNEIEITKKNIERRKHPRVKIFFPIFYNCLDDDDNIIGQNMAVALDISQGGMLLETSEIIDTNYVNLSSVATNNEIFEIKGKVVYSKKDGDGKISVGISFQEDHLNNVKFSQKIIRTFHYKKQDYIRNRSSKISAVSIS